MESDQRGHPERAPGPHGGQAPFWVRLGRLRWGRSPVPAALAVGLTLAVSWGLALVSASPISVTRHTFYVPILLSALRFGPVVTGLVAAAAGLLAGPLAPGDPVLEVWLTRGAFFLGVGVLVSVLSRGLRESIEADLDLLGRERALAAQRAAVLQSVSHEFRTPLTVIHGGVATLRRRVELVDERLEPLLAGMERATDRLSEMVYAVLASADQLEDRAVAVRSMSAVGLERLARRVSQTFQAEQTARIRIDTAGVRAVTVEPDLRMILRCLIDNALKFSPDGEPVEVSARRIGDFVRVEVRDHGPGVRPDSLERMFEPFTQSDPSMARQHGGLGIGLFTARSLARRLDGDVKLLPLPEGGLIAAVELPQRREGDVSGRPRPDST